MIQKFLDDGIGVALVLLIGLVFFLGLLLGALWSDENAKEFMVKERKCPYELKTEYEVARRF